MVLHRAGAHRSFNVGGTGVVTVIDVIGETHLPYLQTVTSPGVHSRSMTLKPARVKSPMVRKPDNLHNIALSISYEFQP